MAVDAQSSGKGGRREQVARDAQEIRVETV